MLIGINWISPGTLPIIRELIQLGIADFCEMMVDNFVHLPSRMMFEALSDIPISLHIVASRFLEKSPDELTILADYLRPWIKDLKPLYVSDHLVTFSARDGRRLPLINELDYENSYSFVKERVTMWQECLDTQLLLENHASLTSRGCQQATFFAALIRDAGAGLLYDFSNAYIAEYNQAGDRKSWDGLIHQAKHFHAAGFRIDERSKLALDTHDVPIAKEVMDDIQVYLPLTQHHHKTLTVEYDAKVNIELWKQDILRIKKNISSPSSANGLSPINTVKHLHGDNEHSAWTDLAKQNLRHHFFYTVPRLLNISNGNNHDIFEDFLRWADENKLMMDWTTHLFLLHWLCQHARWKNKMNAEVSKALLSASVTRWALSGFDHPQAQGIVVAAPCLPSLAVGLWKSKKASQPSKIVMTQLSHPIQSNFPCYAISYCHGNWENLTWKSIATSAH